MSPLPSHKMTVDEFLVWAEGRPGRYELYHGVVYAIAPERAGHARVKFAVQLQLEAAFTRASVACHMLPDGIPVRISETIAHEPDALVYCGPTVDPRAVEIANPVIVVEVLSPSTRHIDASAKLVGYFHLPSVKHYLIIDPEGPPMLHHWRRPDATILTSIIPSGPIKLDPPGLEIDTAAFFA